FLCSQYWLTFGHDPKFFTSPKILIYYMSPGKFAIDVNDFGWMIRCPTSSPQSMLSQLKHMCIDCKFWTWKTKDVHKPNSIFVNSDDVFASIDYLRKNAHHDIGLDGRLITIFATINQVMREFPPHSID